VKTLGPHTSTTNVTVTWHETKATIAPSTPMCAAVENVKHSTDLDIQLRQALQSIVTVQSDLTNVAIARSAVFNVFERK